MGKRPARPEERLVVALDVPALEEARLLVTSLLPEVTWFKVGLELFSVAGPRAVEMVKENGGRVFVDLKLHDIPRTVARAAAALTRLGADMISLHAAGGGRMMEEAVAAVRETATRSGLDRPLLVGITVLTSLGRGDLAALGVRRTPAHQVVALGRLAREAGLDGWVASPREAALLRGELGPDPVIVTPGIRPASPSAPPGGAAPPTGAAPVPKDDQVRVASPAEAVAGGADWLVVGRPITGAADPARAARAIVEDIRCVETVRRSAQTVCRSRQQGGSGL